ncbi:hypothetical protein WHZ78_09525 [Bradyrhizobium symbiodeficiens]|uniref:hypothetical protein n=1 Tax=Bradyrhizobium symbiodeficiens TaxID=1404367 RepID=UPI0030D36F49
MSDWLFLLPTDRVKPLSLDAVDEILLSVKLPHPFVDREQLQKELALSDRWKSIEHICNKSAKAERAKSATAIAKQADVLLDLLLESPVVTLSRHAASVLALSDQARRAVERDVPKPDIAISAFDWLIGHYLASIYKRAFGRDAVTSKHPQTGKVSGPFVRFVESVLQRNNVTKPDGTPYATGSIDGALKRAKKYPVRGQLLPAD